MTGHNISTTQNQTKNSNEKRKRTRILGPEFREKIRQRRIARLNRLKENLRFRDRAKVKDASVSVKKFFNVVPNVYLGDKKVLETKSGISHKSDKDNENENPTQPPASRRSSLASIAEKSSVFGRISSIFSGESLYRDLNSENITTIPKLTSPKIQTTNQISTRKYNFFNFLPKFLYEQFCSAANLYFLFIALGEQIPNLSPYGRYTTVAPMAIILTLSACRELYEDYKRKKDDDKLNNRIYYVWRKVDEDSYNWVEIKSEDLQVGDFVGIQNNQFFPADLVLVDSADKDGSCYIETANLDGETNLKMRMPKNELKNFYVSSSNFSNSCSSSSTTNFHQIQINSEKAHNSCFQVEKPDADLYNFQGNVLIPSQISGTTNQPNSNHHILSKNSSLASNLNNQIIINNPDIERITLSVDQLLPRGCQLRNTKFLVGLVVYTGTNTKLILNCREAPIKLSNVQKATNYQIYYLLIFLVFIGFGGGVKNKEF